MCFGHVPRPFLYLLGGGGDGRRCGQPLGGRSHLRGGRPNLPGVSTCRGVSRQAARGAMGEAVSKLGRFFFFGGGGGMELGGWVGSCVTWDWVISPHSFSV